MKAFVLPELATLRIHLAGQRQILEPQPQGEDGELHWLPVAEATPPIEYRDDPVLPQASPKSLFFSEREHLFRFDGSAFVETVPKVEPRVLFGVRSCDLCAIAYQDQFFQHDPYYQTRRKNTLLVGIDCIHPCSGGFCPTVDAGPFVRDGQADILCHPMTETATNGWLVAPISNQGAQALAELELEPAPKDWATQRETREAQVAAQFPDAAYIRQGVERINQARVPAETWEAMGLQCLSCSGCTNLCPTCSCFTTFDHPTSGQADGGFSRERCWDSCLYEAFQREASGHNPTLGPGQRVERFWYHKFSDSFAKDFGRYGCVGCGRCEKTCPGVIGVHSVMKRISA